MESKADSSKVEHFAHNELVGGSSPSRLIMFYHLPPSTLVKLALVTTPGVSFSMATKLCIQLGLSHATVANLSNTKAAYLQSWLNTYVPNPHSVQAQNIKRQITLKTLRGLRHLDGYPVHYQRTRSNARTQKRLYKRRLTYV